MTMPQQLLQANFPLTLNLDHQACNIIDRVHLFLLSSMEPQASKGSRHHFSLVYTRVLTRIQPGFAASVNAPNLDCNPG